MKKFLLALVILGSLSCVSESETHPINCVWACKMKEATKTDCITETVSVINTKFNCLCRVENSSRYFIVEDFEQNGMKYHPVCTE